jgi:hypothetical protein
MVDVKVRRPFHCAACGHEVEVLVRVRAMGASDSYVGIDWKQGREWARQAAEARLAKRAEAIARCARCPRCGVRGGSASKRFARSVAIRLAAPLLALSAAAVGAGFADEPVGVLVLGGFVATTLAVYFALDRWSFYAAHLAEGLVEFDPES